MRKHWQENTDLISEQALRFGCARNRLKAFKKGQPQIWCLYHFKTSECKLSGSNNGS